MEEKEGANLCTYKLLGVLFFDECCKVASHDPCCKVASHDPCCNVASHDPCCNFISPFLLFDHTSYLSSTIAPLILDHLVARGTIVRSGRPLNECNAFRRLLKSDNERMVMY